MRLRKAGPHAVGADQRDAALVDHVAAAAALHGNAVIVDGEVADLDAKLERNVVVSARGVGERGLQIGAVDSEERRAVALVGD